MTIQEFLTMPVGVTPEDWEREIKRRKRVRDKIYKLAILLQDYEDKLSVLEDERGSKRWDDTQENIVHTREQIRKLEETLA